jgi:dCMP deaminase
MIKKQRRLRPPRKPIRKRTIRRKKDNMRSSWKELLKVAYEESTNSPDPSTQNAALLIDDGSIILAAINEFPVGVLYTEERWERPLKYQFVEHAERNLIYKAAKQGIATDGLTMVSPWAPCTNCARAIIQAGIKCLVRHKDAEKRSPEFWAEEIRVANQQLKEAGVEVLDYHGKIGGPEVRHSGQIWSP